MVRKGGVRERASTFDVLRSAFGVRRPAFARSPAPSPELAQPPATIEIMSPVDRTVVATRADVGERLDLVLRRHLADVGAATRTRVQAWIERGAVAVNGRPVHRPAARAALGDIIGISLPDPAPREPSMGAEAIPLDVLFEDDHFIVVNKPAGLVVHPTYKNQSGTLMNALLWHARHWPHPQRPSLVGRLDKLTSGIVLAAKTSRDARRAATSPGDDRRRERLPGAGLRARDRRARDD